MENQLQVFDFEGSDVRTVIINDKPYFVGKDVATIFGYKNTKDALLKHVDDEDKLGSRFATSGQNREMKVINESGLYSLILSISKVTPGCYIASTNGQAGLTLKQSWLIKPTALKKLLCILNGRKRDGLDCMNCLNGMAFFH